YAGWGGRPGIEEAGAGVYRVFVPALPPALPPGLLAVLRYPDRGGAEVSATAAAWALEQLALGPRQRALVAAAQVLVLITAGGPAPPPAAAAAAEGPARPAVEGPPPPAAAPPPPPPAPPQWPEWLPR
ncbi:MAG: hypothetical protein JO034_24375, partial [Singulisphaera sp.]|nr:hypothetical protein [Singulisphaera sp.]